MAKPTPNYQTGKTAPVFVPNKYAIWNPEQMDMIGKIAYQIIREVTASNPLSVFNKRPVDTGDTLEQVVVKLVESEPYSRDGLQALSPDKRSKLAVQYFNSWFEKKFRTTVYYEDLRFVSENIENRDEIASKLISVLSQSDIYENYTEIKGLLQFGSTINGGSTPFKDLGTVTTDTAGNIQYKKILSKIKNIVKGMKFVNADYNTAGLNRRTDESDIYILAPYELITDIDVESLSGVFNLDKAEIRNRIIEIDTPMDEQGNYTIYVVDQNAIQVVTQCYLMDNQKNADGKFWNYFLHVTRMYAISSLFDGVFFKVATKVAE